MPADPQGGLCVPLHNDPPLRGLRGFYSVDSRRFETPRDRLEITASPRLHLHSIEAPDNGQHGVVGSVVVPVVALDVLSAESLQVGHVSNDGLAVRVLGERGRQVPLIQCPGRARVDPHAPFFHDDVPLRVELAEYRIRHAVRLEREEELRPVRRQLHEVRRRLRRRRGVEALRSRSRQDAIELVAHHQLAGLVLESVDLTPDALDLFRIAGRGHGTLMQAIHGLEESPLRLDIRGADRFRTLEEHVLEQVGDTCLAGPFVDPSDSVLHDERDRRSAFPGKEQEA